MKNGNLQDAFLNEIRKGNIPATIYLVSGFQIKGLIKGFDSFTVLLDCDDRQNLIYKHSIATIVPSKPVSIDLSSEAKA